MKSVKFGNSRFNVPRIGLGTAAIGRPGYINLGHSEDWANGREVVDMQRRTHRLLSEAYRFGVRYFDTARSYGLGEQFLGEWLSVLNSRDVLVVGSKWGYTYTGAWDVEAEVHEVKDHSLEVLNRQWEETTSHLHAFLSIYHIHSATLETGVLENTAVLNQLNALKQQGVLIGLSVSGPKQSEVIQAARNVTINGEPLFQSIQVTWNVFETSTTEQLIAAQQEGRGVIIKEAVANGRLTNRNTVDLQKLEVMKRIADTHEVGIDAIAIAYALQQPWTPVVLSGASTSDQLLSNLRADQVILSAEEMDALAALAEPASEYWEKRANLDWN